MIVKLIKIYISKYFTQSLHITRVKPYKFNNYRPISTPTTGIIGDYKTLTNVEI